MNPPIDPGNSDKINCYLMHCVRYRTDYVQDSKAE